jgi:hypothetical protein
MSTISLTLRDEARTSLDIADTFIVYVASGFLGAVVTWALLT